MRLEFDPRVEFFEVKKDTTVEELGAFVRELGMDAWKEGKQLMFGCPGICKYKARPADTLAKNPANGEFRIFRFRLLGDKDGFFVKGDIDGFFVKKED